MKSLKEWILDWIIMLNSEGFKDTDAELVREQMLDLIIMKPDLKDSVNGSENV